MKRVLLMLVAGALCAGLAVGASSCQFMTDEEITALQEEYYNRGRASVDIEVEEMEAQLSEKHTEGYAEGFDAGYDAGYENGKKDGQAEAVEASDDGDDSSSASKDTGSSTASYSGTSSSSSSGSSGSYSSSDDGNPYGIANSAAMVYVTDYGEKYHSYGCQYLSQSCRGMTLYKAKHAGYTPCSICNPPA